MPEVYDDSEDTDESPVCMNSFGGPARIEEDAFEFNVLESTTPIPASLGSSEMLNATVEAAMVSMYMLDSMVPLVNAPEHGITPLGEDEEGPGFLTAVDVSAAGGTGLLLPGPGTLID